VWAANWTSSCRWSGASRIYHQVRNRSSVFSVSQFLLRCCDSVRSRPSTSHCRCERGFGYARVHFVELAPCISWLTPTRTGTRCTLSRRSHLQRNQLTRLTQLVSHLMINSRSTGSSARRGSICCPHSSLLILIKYWMNGFVQWNAPWRSLLEHPQLCTFNYSHNCDPVSWDKPIFSALFESWTVLYS